MVKLKSSRIWLVIRFIYNMKRILKNTYKFYLAVKTEETLSTKKGADIVDNNSTKIAGIAAGIVVAAIILVVICHRRNKRKVRGDLVSKRYD